MSRRRAARGGFTIVEVLVALVLAAVVASALHAFLAQHRRFYARVEATALGHDALRVAWAVIAPDLREADPSAGDIVLLAPDSLRVRSPVGFAIVCDTRPANERVALDEARGTLEAGDSVLVHGSGGWRLDRIFARDPSGPSPACPGATPTRAVLTLEGGTADLSPGEPMRVFHGWTYHTAPVGDASWLARSDGAGTQVLAGPLAAGGLRFRLLDDAGLPTTDPGSVATVEVVARSETPVATPAGPRSAILTFAVRGRNR